MTPAPASQPWKLFSVVIPAQTGKAAFLVWKIFAGQFLIVASNPNQVCPLLSNER